MVSAQARDHAHETHIAAVTTTSSAMVRIVSPRVLSLFRTAFVVMNATSTKVPLVTGEYREIPATEIVVSKRMSQSRSRARMVRCGDDPANTD